MRVRAEISYPTGSPADVFGLATSEPFRSAVCIATHARSHSVDIEHKADGRTSVVVERTLPAQVPDAVKRLVGSGVAVAVETGAGVEASFADAEYADALEGWLDLGGADLERVDPVVLGAPGAHDDDRRPDPLAARLLDHLPAVEARQHEVEHAHVRVLVAQPGEARLAVRDADRVEAGGSKVARHALGDHVVILDDQDLRHRDHHATCGRSRMVNDR